MTDEGTDIEHASANPKSTAVAPASGRVKAGLAGGRRGFTLIEVLVALGILGVMGSALLLAVGASSRANLVADQQIQAEALVRSQLDSVLESAYLDCDPTCYPLIANIPPQYTMVIDVVPIDTPTCVTDENCNTLQNVTATVSRPTADGGIRPILSISTYKSQR
ncbi:MAG: type II secretion system protein [Chloroflexi bacterium]|nr:type II secretion system protein [Chloroflexota bacterium]